MIVAFDRGGVLDAKPQCVELAKALIRDGHTVWCISHLSFEHEVNSATSDLTRIIPELTLIGWVFESRPFTAQIEYEVGLKKAEIMKARGCSILWDDREQFCKAVRDSGLQAFHVL